MSLGTNDFLENYYTFPTRRSQFSVRQYQDFLLELCDNFIRELHGLGVQKLSITGLPPMECLPLEKATNILGQNDCVPEYSNVALEFNRKLEGLVGKLNKELAGMRMASAPAYDIFYQIITKPSQFDTAVTTITSVKHEYNHRLNGFAAAGPLTWFEVTDVACCSTENIKRIKNGTVILGSCQRARSYSKRGNRPLEDQIYSSPINRVLACSFERKPSTSHFEKKSTPLPPFSSLDGSLSLLPGIVVVERELVK
ncbi:putative zinc finger protein [Hibiscus syriacus]|uniref:Zinc finger protein n=1 Tax=Hibiscus syriacus TaxID=106335 RepID=A0A6A2Z1V9_HIBSY|nr:putative zinc finger protein [Hibiscus syriacus]